MDKTRDVKRGSRFSPAGKRQIKLSDCGGFERSKREKVRKLSVVGRRSSSNEDCEMGFCGSDAEDELRTPVRFKLPKKLFDECNGVDHVPRKLRSAMTKRSRESISPPFPDSKKLNHSTNGVKKSKLSMNRANSAVITKDEEEVAETLYALAGIFTTNDAKNEGSSSEEKLESPEVNEGSTSQAFEVLKRETNSNSNVICPSIVAGESSNASKNAEELQESAVKVDSFIDKFPLELPISSDVKHLKMQSDRSELKDEKQTYYPMHFDHPSELSSQTRLKQQIKLEGGPIYERKPETGLWPVTEVGNQQQQQQQQHITKERKPNGSALWPGLSSTASHGAGTLPPSMQPTAAKIPDVLSSTAKCATRPRSSDNGTSIEKVPRFAAADRSKSWKRCATHVYIGRLIKVLQIPERRDGSHMQCNQLNEGSKQEVMKANSRGVLSTENDENETKTSTLKRLLPQDHQEKQGFDFLSLSGGGGGIEPCTTSKAGNEMSSLNQLHLPSYLQSLPQQHNLMSYPLPQSHFSPSHHPEQLSATAARQAPTQFQLPPYLCSRFSPPPEMVTSTKTTPQHHHQQQQLLLQHQHQQQRIWAAQLAAQYRPHPNPILLPHIQNWQNGTQDSSQLISSPNVSLEVLGPKYNAQMVSSPSRVKWQNHHLPYGHEESVNGFCSDTAQPLQLLCNEHL